jgi:glycosyltransferase involved in cell wall biosynthesis
MTRTRLSADGAASVDGTRQRPVRVCFAFRTYHPVYSGAALRFKRYAPGLQARGIEITVCTTTPDEAKGVAAGMENTWHDLPNGALLPVEEVDGIPVHRIRVPDRGAAGRTLWFNRGILEHCRRAPHRPDVVQLFTPALTGLPWLLGLRRMGISIVATRSMMPELPRSPWRRLLRRTSMRLASRASHREVVGSEAMLEAFQEIGIDGRIKVIPHGVDLERFRPPRSAEEKAVLRSRLGLPEDARVLLFVGAIIPRKGVDHLLEAWCRLASDHEDLHLVLVGPRLDRSSPEHADFRRRLDELADASGARDRLHFTGAVDDVERYMSAADIFVFPSRREGSPNAVAEAMASGLPVVVCPFSGLTPEFGSAGTHYLLSDFVGEAIAAEVEGLLASRDLREALGRQGRKRAQMHMNIERSIDRYAELYFDLARSGGGWKR